VTVYFIGVSFEMSQKKKEQKNKFVTKKRKKKSSFLKGA